MRAFNHITGVIEAVYQELTRSASHPGGTASLTLEDADMPFLHGIKYYAMPPGKRFRCAAQTAAARVLTGVQRHGPAVGRREDRGRAGAAVCHPQARTPRRPLRAADRRACSYQPAPFFVLDEVDAALDNVNVERVARYIRAHAAPGFQFIVISLKDQFYSKADALVGIYRDVDALCSRTLTLNLAPYADGPEAAAQA
jgi:structural maintenance of chromosome 1